jgi:large subunit ribosomal protein L24
MSGSPRSPRRQRRMLYTDDTFGRRRRMTVLLSRELRARFHRRSVPVRKGDTVRVLGGSYKGREERVAKVDRRGYAVTLDNVTLKAADEKMKPLGLRPGRLVITRLNLSDSWRRKSLRIRDEDVTPEERGEPTGEEPEVPEAPAPAVPVEESGAPAETEEGAEEPETAPAAARPRKKPSAPAEDEEPAA